MIALVGRPALHLEQALDAARRGQRDGDPVDRVGRQRDDAARAQGIATAAAIPASSSGDDAGHRAVRSAAGHAMRAILAWTASSARRSAVARASRGLASTSDSIIVATPSSSTGGAT